MISHGNQNYNSIRIFFIQVLQHLLRNNIGFVTRVYAITYNEYMYSKYVKNIQ